MSRQSIMDMDLSERIKEIQATEGRQKAPIEIAGPAGNPTQPGWQIGQIKALPEVAVTTRPLARCPTCGWMTGHASGCMEGKPAPRETGFVGPGYASGWSISRQG